MTDSYGMGAPPHHAEKLYARCGQQNPPKGALSVNAGPLKSQFRMISDNAPLDKHTSSQFN
jgi:hypothetical protein